MTRLAALLLVGSTAVFAQSPETRTLRGKDVAVYNLVGRMKVVAGSGDAVSVEVTRRGPDGAKLRIETGTVRGQESLRIVYPEEDVIIYPDMRGSRVTLNMNSDGTFGNGGDWRSRDRVAIRRDGRGFEGNADLVVSVPRGQRITLRLGVGRLEVANVDGDISLDADAADVDVNGAKGFLNLDTGSGRTELRNIAGDLTVDAGSGGIRVEKVSGGRVSLETGSGSLDGADFDVKEFRAEVGSGGVRVTGLKSPDITVESGSGSANIEVVGPLSRMHVESGSGGMTIRLPANLGAEIEAETGSGGFQSDFEIVSRRLGRNHVVGTIGDGKARIQLESGSGSIRLLKM